MTKARAQLARNKVIVISYVVALALFGISALVIPGFGAGNHMTVLLRQLSILTILAMGQTFVTISGGNDLSIPWMMNSAAVLLTFLGKGSNESMIWLIPVVLLICAAFGALNGIGVAFLHIPPIIMTLGVNYVLEGALLALLQGKNGGNAPEKLIAFCNGGVLGIPNMFLVMLLVCAIGATSVPQNLGNLFGGVCAQIGKKGGQIIYAAVTFVFDAALLALSTIALVGSTYNAFLYFRF